MKYIIRKIIAKQILESIINNNFFGHEVDQLIDNMPKDADYPKKRIMNKIKHLKEIQKKSDIILYRVVFVKNKDDIDLKNIGNHFVESLEDFHEEMLDYLYYQAKEKISDIDQYDDCYLITLQTPTSNIDYYETLRTFSFHPFEDEITIKDDKKVKIKNIDNYFE